MLNCGFNRTFITHVTTYKGCFAASSIDCVNNFVAINHVGNHDLRTFTGEQLGTNATKARGSSGDDGNFSL
jgi:hypothetical protein